LVVGAALPVAVVEAVFTAAAVGLVLKVRPQALMRLPAGWVPSHA
jgi:ABC-type Co2+ transport system permease subunit